ncbi:unnamed protein product [Macrosiphum euphorbiae]|uniref:DUF8207 domain-containing protein n=1 Tax=Macrosiphum euphorbiae TaxID=13131 RepID=A0AAV0Y9J2_9HEMI|nr:unnamed protein product [Macrosiphum euphorbiae]
MHSLQFRTISSMSLSILGHHDIILNGNRYKGTQCLWRLLTHVDPTKPEVYTDDDFNNYKNILIETDYIYHNNDISTGRAKSSGGAKYIGSNDLEKKLIWKEIKEINEKKETTDKKKINKKKENNEIGEGLKKYREDRIEYRYISNVNQVIYNLQFISAEERALNNNFKNEKLGIVHLFKSIMENLIDTPESIEYLLKYVTCLPKEVKISKGKIIKRTLYRLFSTVKTCPRKTVITSLKSGFRVKIPIIKCIENNISKKMSYPFYIKVISKKDTAN